MILIPEWRLGDFGRQQWLGKHQRSFLQNIQFLNVLHEDNLLCVSRRSSKESWKIFLITEWRLGDIEGQE